MATGGVGSTSGVCVVAPLGVETKSDVCAVSRAGVVARSGFWLVAAVGAGAKVSLLAAASTVHVDGGSTGVVGVFPAKGLTIEPITVVIAAATRSIGFCGATAVDTTGRGFVGLLTSGALVIEGTDGADTADVCAAIAAARGAPSVVMDAAVLGTADETGAVLPSDSATRGTTLLEGTASLDLLPGLGNVGAGEVVSPGWATVPPGTVASGDVFGVTEAVDPPVEPDGPAGVDDADMDVVPALDADDFDVGEPDIDELVDDELVADGWDPDDPDGSPDATADPETTAAPIPNAAASPPIRPTYPAAPIPI